MPASRLSQLRRALVSHIDCKSLRGGVLCALIAVAKKMLFRIRKPDSLHGFSASCATYSDNLVSLLRAATTWNLLKPGQMTSAKRIFEHIWRILLRISEERPERQVIPPVLGTLLATVPLPRVEASRSCLPTRSDTIRQLSISSIRLRAMSNPVEIWKSQKHGFDVWPDLVQYAAARTPMKEIETPDLERMKWHGVYYRKNDAPGSYMLRIRLTGCELTAPQAKAIAYVAYDFGYGIVDITTRANIQIQGLKLEDVPAALERLSATGLSCKQTGHDNIRNVFGHPFSGLDPHELYDTRDLCRQIDSIYLGSRIYSDLPRKFNIAMSGSREHGLHYWSQDISFLAHRKPSGEVKFHALIAGTQGQNPQLPWHLPVLVGPEQVVDVTKSLLDLFREQGSREKRDRARFRYLVEQIGVEGVLDFLTKHMENELEPASAPPPPPGGYEELIGWFPQKDADRWVMGLCVPLGRLTWEQMLGLAIAAERWGSGDLRTTAEQGIVVTGIPTGFKDAVATDLARYGLSLYGDTLARNMVACTGKQFCNIAVTETKGHALQLMEKLRQRALTLHGIRIHMSGCPSSCAQHHTADIGLKGVRVRRLLGTREGFDVSLGGGLSGQVHMALPYRLGVDVDQLPQLIEEVIREYYLRHAPGQTFSAYWREKLRSAESTKVGDHDYQAPTWVCESCEHRHKGEDPPIYCPKCAALRRHFARIADESDGGAGETSSTAGTQHTSQNLPSPEVPARTDGFLYAADDAAVVDGTGLTVEVAGREYALFRVKGEVQALDSACPHEGAPLAQGEIVDGVVTCPWHGWTFSACSGCSLEPRGQDLKKYRTKVEDGKIYIETAAPAKLPAESAVDAVLGHGLAISTLKLKPPVPRSVSLKIAQIIQETPDTKTFRLDNREGVFPRYWAGQFARVCVPIADQETWRSFTISSSPTQLEWIDLTIKLNPAGHVSRTLHEQYAVGDVLTLKGPQGAFALHEEQHLEPLVLISAGSGITPMMSILRYLVDTQPDRPCTFLYGARTESDIIFGAECRNLVQQMPNLRYYVTLSDPGGGWTGGCGRLNPQSLSQHCTDLANSRCFLCGPNEFMESFKAALLNLGVPESRIHTEQFQTASLAVTR